jgi:crotonobetainyl-CoA:carnitine CoA-transferase CaiB-like acyl-CoA transferase
VAISTSAESVARRVMQLIGLGDDERFTTFAGRSAHREEVDAHLSEWCGRRTQAEVLAAFQNVDAAAAAIYDMADIAADPHYQARDTVIELDGVRMQGLIARLNGTPGAVRGPVRPLGADSPRW